MRRWVAAFAGLFALGLPGIASLLLVLPQVLANAPGHPELHGARLIGVEALVLAQSAVFVAVAAAVGLACAKSVGLHSLIVERILSGTWVAGSRRRPWQMALAVAGALLVVTIVVDEALIPYYGPAWEALKLAMPADWRTAVAGVLYGGMVEEILFRWGLMSLVAWGVWRIGRRDRTAPPSSRVLVVAIAISAVAFSVGHLPFATMVSQQLPLVLLVRTLAINVVAGAAFGWLYWRHGLEWAMLSHATFHAGLFILTPLLT
jgi:hypothetical protein